MQNRSTDTGTPEHISTCGLLVPPPGFEPLRWGRARTIVPSRSGVPRSCLGRSPTVCVVLNLTGRSCPLVRRLQYRGRRVTEPSSPIMFITGVHYVHSLIHQLHDEPERPPENSQRRYSRPRRESMLQPESRGCSSGELRADSTRSPTGDAVKCADFVLLGNSTVPTQTRAEWPSFDTAHRNPVLRSHRLMIVNRRPRPNGTAHPSPTTCTVDHSCIARSGHHPGISSVEVPGESQLITAR